VIARREVAAELRPRRDRIRSGAMSNASLPFVEIVFPSLDNEPLF
jgi:hypothetical protein